MRPREFTVKCAICGKEFVAHGNRAKYCDVHKKEVEDAQRKKYNEKRREAEKALKDEKVFACDPPHVQEMCRNCSKEDCNGECPAVKAALSTRRWERADELIALHGEGKTNSEIAEILGVTRRCVVYHSQRLGLKPNPPKYGGHNS